MKAPYAVSRPVAAGSKARLGVWCNIARGAAKHYRPSCRVTLLPNEQMAQGRGWSLTSSRSRPSTGSLHRMFRRGTAL